MRAGLLAIAALASCSGTDDDAKRRKPSDGPTTPVDTALPTDTVDAVVESQGVQTCADPGTRETQRYEVTEFQVPATSRAWGWGGMLVAGDLDADGRVEILTSQDVTLSGYTTDDQGQMVVDADPPLLDGDLIFAAAGGLADYDGDGDLDLYVARWVGRPGPSVDPTGSGGVLGYNRLLRNDGAAGFVDVTEAAGNVHACADDDGSLQCHRSTTVSWGDYDRDGDLDLYVGNHGFIEGSVATPQTEQRDGEPDYLYRNDGDGTFTDVSDQLPSDYGYTFAGGFVDLNDDGWLDLYAVHDMGANVPNHVVWNQEGSWFVDPEDNTGLRISMTGMGLAVGDINADGLPDLAIPEWTGSVVLESRKTIGVWLDVTANLGAGVQFDLERDQRVAWGSEFADVDNDGDLDLLTQYGHVYEWGNPQWENEAFQPDALYLNQGTHTVATFEDVGEAWGIADNAIGRGVLVIDLNRDGWVDLIKRDLAGADRVYMANCGSEAWLRLTAEQPGTMNRFGIGTRFEVRADGRRWTRTIRAGGTGSHTAGPPEVTFGLGDIDHIDTLVVRWPDGESTVLEGVDTRQGVKITRQ